MFETAECDRGGKEIHTIFWELRSEGA